MLARSWCRHGLFVYPEHDLYVGRCLAAYGEWSEGEVLLMSHYLKAGSAAVEVGSNIGAHTVPMSRMVGSDGLVIAFEPQRVVFQVMCANLINNEILNVRAVNAAVGAEPGATCVPELSLDSQANFGGVRIGASAGLSTAVCSIDQLELDAVDFIKIDAEGCEASVLLGAQDTIRRCLPAILLEYNLDHQKQINDVLGSFPGYKAFLYVENLFNPLNFNRAARDLFPGMASFNLLLCRESPPDLGLSHVSRKEIALG